LTRIASALSISGGAVTVGTNNDKTNYSLAVDQDVRNVLGTVPDSAGTGTLLTRLTALRAAALDYLDVLLSTRATQSSVNALGSPLQAGSYVAPLDAAGTRGAVGLASANLDTQLSGLAADIGAIPTTPLLAADYTAPDNATIADIDLVAAKLDSTLEADGLVYRYTANALEQAPAGGGGVGGTDWTDGERAQIRDALGVDGAKTASSGGVLQTILTFVGGIVAAISGVAVTVVAPVLEGGEVALVRGDDYYAVDGRALTWAYKNGIDLTGASLTFNLGSIHAPCSVLNPGTSEQTIVCELAKEDTSALLGDVRTYSVFAVLANTHEVTLYKDVANIS